MTDTKSSHDVVIMGGGLAGLTLSIQLKRADPSLDVMVAERLPHPPPDAAFKVGESTIEGAGYYFRNVLGLQDYLEAEHLVKPGLRFYFSNGDNSDITDRVEFGDSTLPTWEAYQIDRGRFEAKLAEYAQEHGVVFLDRCKVTSVALGTPHHTIGFSRNDESWTAETRWIIDGTGRTGLLKRQLGLAEEVAHNTINAVWFRVNDKIDVGSWDDCETWQGRTAKPDYRWRSTNHLMGEGYWVWVIPLGSDYTSIGIVADERFQPLSELDSFDKALAWLEIHEPQAHKAVAAVQDRFCDFKVLKKLAFSSKQMYSTDRWCVLGNAAVFHDPFYSPGSDVISVNNTYVTSLIQEDRAGHDLTARVEKYNEFFLRYFADPLFSLYTDKYAVMGNSQIFVAKVMWDYYWYWAVVCPMFFQGKLSDLPFVESVTDYVLRANALSERMQALFIEWNRLDAGSTVAGHYVDIAYFDSMTRMHDELGGVFNDDELRENFARNVEFLEDLATEWFWRAVRVLPDPPERAAINPYAISLDPNRWSDDGLFIGGPEEDRNPGLAKELSSVWFEPVYS